MESRYEFLISLLAGTAFYIAGDLLLSATRAGLDLGKRLVKSIIFGPLERRVLVKQLPDVLTLVANSLQAGFTLFQALELAATESDYPISKHLTRAVEQVALGSSMKEALENWQSITRIPELSLITTAVVVQQRLGGNLTEVLLRLSEDMQQKEQLRKRIKTLTSQGKLTGVIIGLLPIGVLYAMLTFNPEFGQPLVATAAGRALLLTGGTLEAIGCIMVWRICRIKV